MKAPFPYYGGKKQWADTVWERFGDQRRAVYVEPFAGSLAVLLSNDKPFTREIVCDTSGHICNFWRAISEAPEEVAKHADWPTIHQDLASRHKWLIAWAREHADELMENAEYYDAKAAGWWCWGISNWIGGGWCTDSQANTKPKEQIPSVNNGSGGKGIQTQRKDPGNIREKIPNIGAHDGGRGIQVQREDLGKPKGQIPHVKNTGGGQGVQAQREDLGKIQEQRPHVYNHEGGQGVQAQRKAFPEEAELVLAQPLNGDRLMPWFFAIAHRLKRVIVLNRSWESALTPTLLQQTATSPKPPVRIFMDPPYLTIDRESTLYQSDADGHSEDVAQTSYDWAVANAERPGFIIAYCCHDGDFTLPAGWEKVTKAFRGIKKAERRSKADCIMFSQEMTAGNQSTLL